MGAQLQTCFNLVHPLFPCFPSYPSLRLWGESLSDQAWWDAGSQRRSVKRSGVSQRHGVPKKKKARKKKKRHGELQSLRLWLRVGERQSDSISGLSSSSSLYAGRWATWGESFFCRGVDKGGIDLPAHNNHASKTGCPMLHGWQHSRELSQLIVPIRWWTCQFVWLVFVHHKQRPLKTGVASA